MLKPLLTSCSVAFYMPPQSRSGIKPDPTMLLCYVPDLVFTLIRDARFFILLTKYKSDKVTKKRERLFYDRSVDTGVDKRNCMVKN